MVTNFEVKTGKTRECVLKDERWYYSDTNEEIKGFEEFGEIHVSLKAEIEALKMIRAHFQKTEQKIQKELEISKPSDLPRRLSLSITYMEDAVLRMRDAGILE